MKLPKLHCDKCGEKTKELTTLFSFSIYESAECPHKPIASLCKPCFGKMIRFVSAA